MKAFADKVKEARISLGLSQTQLAQEVGVSPRSVQAYERGEKTPLLRIYIRKYPAASLRRQP